MSNPLTVQLGNLAENLADLRRRFRHTARLEVAQAVGEALRELARTLICGPVRVPRAASPYAADWDDAWQEADADPWRADVRLAEDTKADKVTGLPARWQSVVLMGLAAARWGFLYTRRYPPAVVIGLVVVLAAYGGGPTVEALLDVWSSATDLLRFPDPTQRSNPLENPSRTSSSW